MVSLNRRQSELEDAELELMEQRETAQAALDEVDGRLAGDPRAGAATPRPAATQLLAEITKDEESKAASRPAARSSPTCPPT